MIQHVFERASRSRYLTSGLVVATDNHEIASACRAFGAPVRMTLSSHPTGTDRVAEVASCSDAEIVVNIQGDEPLIDPDAIDAAVLSLLGDPACAMATLMKRIENVDEVANPNVVKVVVDLTGRAIYFSRLPIPYVRDEAVSSVLTRFKHIGLYVYRRDLLLNYSDLPVGPLEQSERLEQLRALENGHSIRVVETEYDSLGVDTPEDLERVSKLFEASLLFPHG